MKYIAMGILLLALGACAGQSKQDKFFGGVSTYIKNN